MRAVLLVLLFLVPAVSAGLGPYGDDGWPVNVDGESTNPTENRVGPVTLYPYYPILTAEVQRLAQQHPDVVRLTSIGQSTIGLELWMLEIRDFDNPDALPLEEREVVWVDGGTHSNEYSGVYFALAIAQFLIEGYGNDEQATWIVENRHTWVLPMVNPDGSNAFGRLNANLVNINRNYPVVWDGVGNDALMNNRGPEPASEIETQLTIEWYNKTQPDYFAGVHCCGVLWLYPYGEEGVDPLPGDHQVFEAVCDRAFPDVRDKCGPIWSTIYPASGSSVDTVYEYTGAIAFGYEMSGRGAVGLWGEPFTVQDVAEQEYESWDGLMRAFEEVHRYGAHPVLLDHRIDGDDLHLTFGNIGFGNLTHLMVSFDAESKDDGTWYGDDRLPVTVPPGGSLTMTVPASDATSVLVHYIKREMQEPDGLRRIDLTQADALAEGHEFHPVDSPGSLGANTDKPTPAPAILLIGVAILYLARRR